MTAFVRDDPKPCSHEASGEAVEGPETEASDGVQVHARQLDELRGDTSIEVHGQREEYREASKVPDADAGQVSGERRRD